MSSPQSHPHGNTIEGARSRSTLGTCSRRLSQPGRSLWRRPTSSTHGSNARLYWPSDPRKVRRLFTYALRPTCSAPSFVLFQFCFWFRSLPFSSVMGSVRVLRWFRSWSCSDSVLGSIRFGSGFCCGSVLGSVPGSVLNFVVKCIERLQGEMRRKGVE